jgi:CopG-like RHH_1 or ribbon-helix-helix domain, RHH_5
MEGGRAPTVIAPTDKKLREMAAKESRSLSGMIALILKRAVDQK